MLPGTFVVGISVHGAWLGGLSVVGASVMGVSVIGMFVFGASVAPGPPADTILISAQLTNVSCFFPSPTPQLPFSSQPQLFPTVHHHRITQWSHVRPLGRTSLIVYFPFSDECSCHVLEPSGCKRTYSSCSSVMGRFCSFPTLNRKNH